jgi:hypothetical protein
MIVRRFSENMQAAFLAFGLMFASFLFLAYLTLKPANDGSDIAAVFPPTMTLAEISTAIAGLPYTLVRTGFVDEIVILRPEDQASLEQVKTAGAYLVISAVANGGCVFLKDEKSKRI